jgi:hypothetical protein
MRAGPVSRFEPRSVGAAESSHLGWMQAGFSSFAYRLAHLHALRPAAVGALAVIFFLG